MKVAVAFSKQQLCPRVCKSTTLSRIDFMPLSVDKFLVSKFESIGMFSGFFSAILCFPWSSGSKMPACQCQRWLKSVIFIK